MFDDLSAGSAKQLSRQGGVLLMLERNERIDMTAAQLPVGPTAA